MDKGKDKTTLSGGFTVGVKLEGYEKVKGQLRNIEATLDRISDKQKQIGMTFDEEGWCGGIAMPHDTGSEIYSEDRLKNISEAAKKLAELIGR